MVQVPGKLASMMRGAEAVEHQAGEEFRRIQAVYELRLAEHNALRDRADRLRQKLSELREQCLIAEQAGSWGSVSAREAFRRRIIRELGELQAELSAQEPLVAKARERTDDAEEELHAARIERKKLETIARQRARVSQLEASAREEDFQDELTTNRAPKVR